MYKKNSTYLLGDAAYTRFLKKLPSLLTSASLQLKRNVILNRYRAEAWNATFIPQLAGLHRFLGQTKDMNTFN